MTYRVRLTARASRNLGTLYRHIDADSSTHAQAWFIGLEKAVLSLGERPHRCPMAPEDPALRHLLYGSRPHGYRIIFTIDETNLVVIVMQIRHGARRRIAPGP